MKSRVAILISGNGSNLQSLLDRQHQFDIRLVIASKTSAYGIKRAQRFGVPVLVVPPSEPKNLAENWIQKTLLSFRIETIVLAGFMKVLSSKFVESWQNSIINIHPSLLPLYPGLRGFESALEAGDIYAGVTVHHVIDKVDEGQTIIQRRFLIPQHRTINHQQLALHITEQKAYAEGLRKLLCHKHIQRWS